MLTGALTGVSFVGIPQEKAGAPGVLEIVRFPQGRIPFLEWKDQHGWRELRGSAESFFIEDGVLTMQSEDSSTTIGTQFKPKVDPGNYPGLEFTLKVDEVPPGANVTRRDRDDAAFRLFVVFDKGGFLSITPPHTIGYVWDSSLETGESGRAATFGQVRYIVIGDGGEGLGEWHVIRRNVADDYRRLFGPGPVPAIEGIGLKCDSNHTGGRASSSIGTIRFYAQSER
jgi:hypothetical protein